MGVGDYVHSKEFGQLRSATNEASNQPRQKLAEQARVVVPATSLVASIPQGGNGGAHLDRHYEGTAYAEQPPHASHEIAMQKDMFDTDVEGVDDSTVAGTSVLDVDEIPRQLPPPPNVQHQEPEPKPFYQFRPGRRTYGSNWYENLGDKAMKTAGFESDDADDDDGSQLTSLAGDDERANDTSDWYFSHKHRHAEEPLSKRLETFWSASKKAHPKSSNQKHGEPSKHPDFEPLASNSTVLPLNGSRKITLPRSMIPRSSTTTPRTRFSPPKPSLIDQLDISPTRATGPRAQPGRKNSVLDFAPHDSEEDVGLGLFSNELGRRDSELSMTAFDITNMDVLDDDDTIRDPFSRRASVKRSSSHQAHLKKRNLEPDYPPEILYKKTFAELQAESFDHNPAATVTFNPSQGTQASTEEDKFSLLMKLSDQDRQTYLSNLTIDEWEDCGDQLIDQFTHLLSKMKDLRRARRRTAAVFEAEIRRRHETVEEQTSEISRKLDGMRTGGTEVLRGRTP